MAHPNLTLIGALRQAAANLRNGAPYAWGNHGSCNCGHVLQVVTHLSREEIEDKVRRLAEYAGGASPEEVRRITDRAWNLDREPNVQDLLPEA